MKNVAGQEGIAREMACVLSKNNGQEIEFQMALFRPHDVWSDRINTDKVGKMPLMWSLCWSQYCKYDQAGASFFRS